MTYRKLNRDDVVAFQRLRLFALQQNPSAFGSSFEESSEWSQQVFVSMLEIPDADGAIYGAFDGDRLAGIGGLKRENRLKERHKGLIWGIYVHPDFRGRGAGEEIMQWLIGKCRTMTDLVFAKLTVESSNHAAKRLYEKLGFIKFGCEPNALRVGENFFDEDYMALTFARKNPLRNGSPGVVSPPS